MSYYYHVLLNFALKHDLQRGILYVEAPEYFGRIIGSLSIPFPIINRYVHIVVYHDSMPK